jgi:hypothetical protein
MSEADHKAERRNRVLDELSELSLAVARDLQARVLAAEEPEAAARLAHAFQGAARSVRQCLALEARLSRDVQREAREDAAAQADVTAARLEAHRARVKATVERMVWTEIEGPEAQDRADALDDLLVEDSLAEGFLDEPMAAHVARLRHDLGLAEAKTPDAPVPQPRRGLYHKPRPGRPWRSRRPPIDFSDIFGDDDEDDEEEPAIGDAPPISFEEDWRSSA